MNCSSRYFRSRLRIDLGPSTAAACLQITDDRVRWVIRIIMTPPCVRPELNAVTDRQPQIAPNTTHYIISARKRKLIHTYTRTSKLSYLIIAINQYLAHSNLLKKMKVSNRLDYVDVTLFFKLINTCSRKCHQ